MRSLRVSAEWNTPLHRTAVPERRLFSTGQIQDCDIQINDVASQNRVAMKVNISNAAIHRSDVVRLLYAGRDQ